ncbi:MAG: C2H2-type zinc finger protein [Methanobacteriota archaeon]
MPRCPHCKKIFKSNEALKEHMKAEHANAVPHIGRTRNIV